MRAARVHRAARRRGAAWPLGGARAAGRADAAHRRAHACDRGRSGIAGPRRGVPAGAGSNWAGPSAATCGSTPAGPRPMPPNIRKHAAELVALAPDVILAAGAAAVGPLLQATRTVPIVFAGRRRSGRRRLRRQPGAAGRQRHRLSCQFEYSLSGKWLELLKEIAPGVTRAAVLRDPAIAAGIGQFGAIQSVAPSLGVEVSPVNVRDAGEIERAVAAFARSPNGGLIVTASASAIVHRDLIITLAARHKLPAVYTDALRRRRRPDLLWARFRRPVPARGRLRRPHPQGREAGRPAGAGADQVRAGDQPQDRQGARPRRAADRCSRAPTR